MGWNDSDGLFDFVSGVVLTLLVLAGFGVLIFALIVL